MTNRGLQLAAYLCIRYNDIDVFMILLPTIPICEPLANGLTLLEEAIRWKRVEMIQALIQYGAIFQLCQLLQKEKVLLNE